MNLWLVFVGGGAGAVMRWLIAHGSKSIWSSVWSVLGATMIANMVACLLLGYLVSRGAEQRTMLVLAVGFCGGMSTFSTFSHEVLGLIKSNQWLTAVLYAMLSVGLGLLAVAIGMRGAAS